MKTGFLSLSFFIPLFLIHQSFGQSCFWAKSAGGNLDDYAVSLATDATGNVYVAGFFNSPTITFDSIILTNSDITVSSSDIYLAKYDAAGNVIWVRSAYGNRADFASYVTVDGLGNIYLVGSFKSPVIMFDTIALINSDSSGSTNDIFLVKYDGLGNLLWAKSFGGKSIDISCSVATNNNGYVYIAGNYNSKTIAFDTFVLHNSDTTCTWPDIYLVKFTATGNVLWAKGAGSSNIDEVSNVTTDTFGNAYISGWFNGNDSSSAIAFDTINLYYYNGMLFLAKYDSSGNVIWAKNTGNRIDGRISSCIDFNCNSYIVGAFMGPSTTIGTTTLINGSFPDVYHDIFIVKYDGLGNILWAKRAGGINDDYPTSIMADASGGIYMTGYYNSPTITFGSHVLINEGIVNFFLTKYDSFGNVLWAVGGGGNYTDHACAESIDGSGNVIIAGDFRSIPFNFGIDTLTNNGVCDVFLAKYASIDFIPKVLSETQNLHLYPNPATNSINLSINISKDIFSIKIYDIIGNIVYQQTKIEENTFTNQSINIDLSNLLDGIYFLKASGNQINEYKQFIVKH